MERNTFETTTRRRENDPRRLPPGFLARHKPQIVVCALVVALLFGGAYYSSRVSEGTPKVVYSTSLEEAKAEAQTTVIACLLLVPVLPAKLPVVRFSEGAVEEATLITHS